MEEPKRINDAAELKKLVDEKGKEWLVAAMVEGQYRISIPQNMRKY